MTKCAFCSYTISGGRVSAAGGDYCLGHEPSMRPTEKDKRVADLEYALRPFTFEPYPEKFQSDDGGCTEVIVADADVQDARRILQAATV